MFSPMNITRSIAMFTAATYAATLLAAPPTGWILAGSKPAEYDCAIDPSTTYNKQLSTYLKSKAGIQTTGFGTLMQMFSSEQYAGKRVRLTAFVKSDNIGPQGADDAWAGLWMRVDGPNGVQSFDNMQSRAIKGTSTWQPYSVVLDVPQDAKDIALGILLHGSGAVWISGIKFEVVGPEVPVTSYSAAPKAPVNLSLQEN